jgi:hypothetical protein
VLQYHIEAGDFPPLYKLNFKVEKWMEKEMPVVDSNFKDWCKVNETTGTVTMIYQPYAHEDNWTRLPKAIVKVELFQGDTEIPLLTERATIHGCNAYNPSEIGLWVVRPAKTRIVFDEKIRVGLDSPSTSNYAEGRYMPEQPIFWSVSDKK